jgi:hypothetical protein
MSFRIRILGGNVQHVALDGFVLSEFPDNAIEPAPLLAARRWR